MSDSHPTADVPDPGTASFDPAGTRLRDSAPVGEAGQLIAGRYKLVEEVGEGGMGTVWMAEQKEPVKRLVAIKLIKAGMDSKAVLARFEAERQALAVMDHPNIAKVLDGGIWAEPGKVGPGAGRPFFAMELVKGTPITAFADARKLSLRQRLELFVPVCSAIQHAHMKGVIHRDIKPSNVLVALYDDKPVPKVIDFGIAKATGQALTDKTLHTGFGAVVGTPEYMSPEQASLNNMDIDTRSDVYSLGALLYELLAGSPPFTKRELETAGLLEMLRVVRETEPQRPSAKLSTAAARPSIAAARGLEAGALAKLLRSELDWLVMKALEKDRNRRYDSANSLSADVQRYLAGEAVTAVPPSLGYRVRKWVRKNKGLVSAAGLVAGTFTVGIAGTTWGLLRAEQEAERARAEEQKVRDEQGKTQAALEQSERNLVHSFLRPVGYNAAGFDQAELVALDELARQEDDRIKLLFLREALADGDRALRVARHAERVVQAAVGTSPKRRAAALELTSARQRDKTADPRVRLCACLLAVELGGDDLPALGETFDTLLARKVTDWDNFVGQLPARVHPTKEVVLADFLVGVIGRMTDANALSTAGNGLAALSPRLDPATANRAADALVATLGKATDSAVLSTAGNGLGSLAPRLNAAAANRATDALVGVLGRTADAGVIQAAGNGLGPLAPRLDPSVAPSKLAQASDALVGVLGRVTDATALQAAGNVLASLAQQLEPASAGRAADALAAVLAKTTDLNVLNAAGSGLSAISPRLDAATAGRVADALVVVLGRTTDGNVLGAAGNGLGLLASRLEPANATRAADALVAALNKATDSTALWSAASGLVSLAARLDPATAGRASDALVGVLGRTTDATALQTAGNGLTALAPRLDPSGVTKLADALVGVLGKTTDGNVFQAARNGLVAVAPSLDPTATVRAADALVALLGKSTDSTVLLGVGSGLSSLAPRLDPAGATKVADALMGVLSRGVNPWVLQAAGAGLVALAPRLDPAVAQGKLAQATDVLVAAFSKTTDQWVLQATGSGLSSLAPRLDAAAAGRAADALVGVFGRTTDATALQTAGNALAALAPRLDPAAAAKVADVLIGVLGKTTDYWPLQAAGNGLVGLAPQLDAATASQRFDALVAVLGKSTSVWVFQMTGGALTALAARLDAAGATRGADTLVGVLGKVTDTNALQSSANGLAAVAPRLDPAAAGRTADALVTLLGKQSDVNTVRAAGTALAALAPQLDPVATARCADALVKLLEIPDEPDKTVITSRTLVTLGGGLTPPQRLTLGERAGFQMLATDRLAAAGISEGMGGTITINSMPEFGQLLDPVTSVSFLVDLLRDPGCVGAMRDTVLFRLEELAYPNPVPAAVLAGLTADPLRALTLVALKQDADDSRKQNRRFRTVSDAAKWLTEKHPEIELDRPYHKGTPTK